MSSIKIRKLTLQYSYLLLEKDEVYTVCQEQEKEIAQYIKDNHPEKHKQIYEEPQSQPQPIRATKPPSSDDEISNESTEEQSTPEKEIEKNKNNDTRLLYRRIAAKTHPDKTGDNSLAPEFSLAAAAYAANDLAALLNLAGQLNIELVTLSAESLLLLEKNVENLHDEILKKKSTSGWKFYKAQSEEEKEAVIQKIISHLLGVRP